MTQQFKKFKIGDLFKEIVVGKQPNTTNRFKNHLNGMIPVITGVTMNNGIGFYSYPEDSKIYKNILTLSKDGEYAGKPFIQNSNVLLGGHSLGLIPKNDSKYMLMYVSSIFNKLLDIGFWKHGGVMGSVTLNKLKEISLNLPITADGELDFDYMENYIKNIERKYIRNLRGSLDDKITNLLELTQKTEDNISDEHVQVLKEEMRLEYSQKEFKEFKVKEILNIKGTKSLNSGSINFSNVGVNFVGRTKINNGIQGKVDSEQLQFKPNMKNSITISQVGTIVALYQAEDYYTSQNIVSLNLKERELNRYIGLYFVSVLNKILLAFEGYNTPKLNDISEFVLTLPVTSDGELDYDFMGDYVRSLESIYIYDFRVCEEERIGLIEGLLV